MNAIAYAINEIMHTIPYEVLHAAMTHREDRNVYGMISLEEKIVNKVIRQRVMMAANVIGGIEHIIPIGNIYPTVSERMYTVYQIPNELTMDKEIVSVLSLSFLPNAGFMGVSGGFGSPSMVYNPNSPIAAMASGVTNVASRIAASHATSGILSNARTELVARNTVAVYANYQSLANYGLRVVLENDANMNNIQPRSYRYFSQLCVLATKAYIYLQLNLAINSGYLSGGQELGVFRNIIDKYESAEEEYQTFLREQWGGVAFMNDAQRHANFLQSLLQPDL